MIWKCKCNDLMPNHAERTWSFKHIEQTAANCFLDYFTLASVSR